MDMMGVKTYSIALSYIHALLKDSLPAAVLCADCWLMLREGQYSGSRTTPAPWPPTAAL